MKIDLPVSSSGDVPCGAAVAAENAEQTNIANVGTIAEIIIICGVVCMTRERNKKKKS
jgi:hypothetical protein